MPFTFQDGQQTPTPAPAATGSINDLASQLGIDLTTGTGMGGPTSYTSADQRTYNDPFIFMGQHKITKSTNANVAENIIASGGSVQGSKLSDLQRQFIRQNQEKQRHWAYLLALTGYAGSSIASDPSKAAEYAKTAPLSDVLDMHNKFLQDAADQFNLYRRKITPQGLMKEMLAYRLGDKFNGDLNSVSAGGAGSTSLAGTHTATSKSVDFMSPEDAKGLVRGMLQQQLGRDPTQAEYEDFLSTIHAAERAHPSVTKTTYTTDEQGNTTNQSSTSSGGLNASGYDQLAYEKAKSLPSWAIWQAVGTYAPALFQALDAPVSGV